MKSIRTLKAEILKKYGYGYDFNREVYYSKKAKKIFSVEAIEDHDIEWLRAGLTCPNDDWKFYFNIAPSSNIKAKLIGYLNR